MENIVSFKTMLATFSSLSKIVHFVINLFHVTYF